MSTVITILVALLIFGVLIISHEFGHFIAAKKSGVDVLEFSAGMGPLIASKNKNGTQYSLRALPIGGFCKMKGEDEDDEDGNTDMSEGSFNAASAWKRIIILASGALMNFLIAILIFFIVLCINGTDASTTIASVASNSPAYEAGIEQGDTILEINGTQIKEWDDITTFIRDGNGEEITVKVRKSDNSEAEYKMTPSYSDEENAYLIGITPKVKTNVFKAIGRSFYLLGYYITVIFGIFVDLFRGNIGIEAFNGPIGATVIIGQYIPQGIVYILSIAASISVSLGFFNLLPIPALDGSRIFFTLIEMIKGSPINKKAEGTVHMVGFALLMAFAAFIAYRDIITFF